LKSNSQFHPIISKYILISKPDAYPIISKVISISNISQETFQIYSSNGSIRKFLIDCSISDDEKIINSGLKFLSNFASVLYSPEYQLFVPKIYDLIRNQSSLTAQSYPVFALLSQFKEYHQPFIHSNLKQHFELLKTHPEHQESAKRFLQYIK
jgi:hypothetical protein